MTRRVKSRRIVAQLSTHLVHIRLARFQQHSSNLLVDNIVRLPFRGRPEVGLNIRSDKTELHVQVSEISFPDMPIQWNQSQRAGTRTVTVRRPFHRRLEMTRLLGVACLELRSDTKALIEDRRLQTDKSMTSVSAPDVVRCSAQCCFRSLTPCLGYDASPDLRLWPGVLFQHLLDTNLVHGYGKPGPGSAQMRRSLVPRSTSGKVPVV